MLLQEKSFHLERLRLVEKDIAAVGYFCVVIIFISQSLFYAALYHVFEIDFQ